MLYIAIARCLWYKLRAANKLTEFVILLMNILLIELQHVNNSMMQMDKHCTSIVLFHLINICQQITIQCIRLVEHLFILQFPEYFIDINKYISIYTTLPHICKKMNFSLRLV